MTVIQKTNRCSTAAYTLVEVIVSVAVLALVGGSLSAGFATGFTLVRASREDARATQIMVEKMETLRLQRWGGELTNFPPTFTAWYDSDATTNYSPQYQGTIQLSTPAAIPAGYQTSMLAVTVTVFWTNGERSVSTRQMQTLVARYGLQNYISK
jgi:type II secretory pathway pseudopilin PulG